MQAFKRFAQVYKKGRLVAPAIRRANIKVTNIMVITRQPMLAFILKQAPYDCQQCPPGLVQWRMSGGKQRMTERLVGVTLRQEQLGEIGLQTGAGGIGSSKGSGQVDRFPVPSSQPQRPDADHA